MTYIIIIRYYNYKIISRTLSCDLDNSADTSLAQVVCIILYRAVYWATMDLDINHTRCDYVRISFRAAVGNLLTRSISCKLYS